MNTVTLSRGDVLDLRYVLDREIDREIDRIEDAEFFINYNTPDPKQRYTKSEKTKINKKCDNWRKSHSKRKDRLFALKTLRVSVTSDLGKKRTSDKVTIQRQSRKEGD